MQDAGEEAVEKAVFDENIEGVNGGFMGLAPDAGTQPLAVEVHLNQKLIVHDEGMVQFIVEMSGNGVDAWPADGNRGELMERLRV